MKKHILFIVLLCIMSFFNARYFHIAKAYMKQPGATKSIYTMPDKNKYAFFIMYLSDLMFVGFCFYWANNH